MNQIILLFLLFSCANANYRKSSKDCPDGGWQVFYDPYGHPVKRKITQDELDGKKLWVDRIDFYQASYNNEKYTINREGEIFKGQKRLTKIENLNHLETKEFLLYVNDDSILIIHSKNEHAKVSKKLHAYYFSNKTLKIINKNFHLKDLGLAPEPIKFSKVLQLNPKSGERYLSEYAPLSYQCEKN